MYNTGQATVVVKDLTGKEYPAIAAVNRKRRVNGQREIALSFLYTEINKDFIREIDFHWKILFGGEWYTIINPGKSTDGDYIQVNVAAVLSFFVDLNGYYLQDKAEDKSFTATTFFKQIFDGTGYNYVLVDSLEANTFNYQDNQSRTERFLYGIDRFGAEYVVRGNLVYIHALIGSDKDIILHEDLNVNSVSIDVDASGFHTWAKGYGDLPEDTDDENADYKIKTSYTSPLASIYGEIEGPAIKDGKYKHVASLIMAIKEQVENSYTVSTEIDAIDLTNNGYPEMVLEEGDRVWLYVSELDFNQQVRVVEIDETFDWEGNLISTKYTVGNEGIAARYKTQQYDTLKDFKDILAGKKKLQADWFPDAVRRASDIINGNLDSHFKYEAGEIIGINRNNPNGYMRFNTDGLGFSRDGGKTYRSAVTYEGIVAESINAASLQSITSRTGSLEVTDWLTISSDNRGIISRYDYGDRYEQSYNPRWFVGDFQMGYRYQRMLADVHAVNPGNTKGPFLYYSETFYGADMIKLRQYRNSLSALDNGAPQFHFDIQAKQLVMGRGWETGIVLDGESHSIYAQGESLFGERTRVEGETTGLLVGRINAPVSFQTLMINNDRPGLGDLTLGRDGVGRYIKSTSVRNRTYDLPANVYVSPDGVIGFASSSSKYKMLIEEATNNIDIVEKLNQIKAKTWFSRSAYEQYAESLNYQLEDIDTNTIKRTYGLIAEDLHNLGLTDFVSYDSQGEVVGIHEGRLVVPLIMWNQMLQKRIERLEQVNE